MIQVVPCLLHITLTGVVRVNCFLSFSMLEALSTRVVRGDGVEYISRTGGIQPWICPFLAPLCRSCWGPDVFLRQRWSFVPMLATTTRGARLTHQLVPFRFSRCDNFHCSNLSLLSQSPYLVVQIPTYKRRIYSLSLQNYHHPASPTTRSSEIHQKPQRIKHPLDPPPNTVPK